MLSNLDTYFCVKSQLAVTRLQERTSKTNFWLAKWACVISIIATVFLFIVLSMMVGLFSIYNLFFFLGAFVIIIIFFQDIIYLEKKDAELHKDSSCVMNKRRVDGKKVRIFSISMAACSMTLLTVNFLITGNPLVEIIIFTLVVLQTTFIFSMYFGDCTPLPPSGPSGKNKTKKWYNST